MLKLYYDRDTFTVNFDPTVAPMWCYTGVRYGATIEAPAAPDRLTFDGWYKEEALENAWNLMTKLQRTTLC